jgi:hypothetical protein
MLGRGVNSPELGQGPAAGSCEDGIEPLGSLKYWEFLDWLCNC